MNKPITRVFYRRSESDFWWQNRNYNEDICIHAVNALWNIPETARKLWVTLSTEPDTGYSFRLQRFENPGNKWLPVCYGRNLGLAAFWHQLMAKCFDKTYIYATVHYE